MSGRDIISVLLVMIVIPSLTSMPAVVSQRLTTITMSQTITTSSASTYTSTTSSLLQFTIAYLTMTTNYVAVKITAAPWAGACRYLPLAFESKRGQEISFSFSSTAPIDFYIMTEEQYIAWYDSRACPVIMALDKHENVGRYEGKFIPDADGKYEFILSNSSTTTDVELAFTAQMQLFSTYPVAFMTTIITTSMTTSTITGLGPILEQNSMAIAVLLMVVIAFAIIYLKHVRRGERAVETTRIYE